MNLWDSGSGQDHATRALLLLSADGGTPDILDLPIGERDRRLFDLRQRLFGSRINAVEPCPACGTRLEIAFTIDDARVVADALTDGWFTLEADGIPLEIRLPTSRDLLAIRDRADTGDARLALLERCVAGIDCHAVLSSAAQESIAQAMAERDPQADVLLDLACSDCGHTWQRHFDVVEYLWAELDRAARRLFRDVHALATAYGWSEAAILSLSARRRAIYLGMVLDD